ncbi:hypothetical protein [Methanobacterium alcaliphilum]|uniref:hypothetical protein n=1 Tax=Methanobacterium alcaliphilum TaxID=392018 RepID=UPI002009DE9F|nr:hypothetical protein [Methanobacterium alcaliphilum]MCK9150431.1 hypothetical protein [Methanobacterium alcaliphilum]
MVFLLYDLPRPSGPSEQAEIFLPVCVKYMGMRHKEYPARHASKPLGLSFLLMNSLSYSSQINIFQ